jgi:hypothetical protein
MHFASVVMTVDAEVTLMVSFDLMQRGEVAQRARLG